MKVDDLMAKLPSSIHQNENLNEAARIMWELDCGFLTLFNDEQEIIGVITDRDICMAGYTQGLPLQQIPCHVVMLKTLVSCEVGDNPHTAEDLMQRYQIRRLPVLDKQKQLCGVLSLNDIALAYQDKQVPGIKADEVADTLSAVCRHQHGSLLSLAS